MSNTDRSCGDCSECCRVLAIKATNKPPRVWCEHAKASCGGTGCAIYDTRPKVCSDYACTWKDPGPLGELFTPETQPHRIGMIVQTQGVGDEVSIEAIIGSDDPTPEQAELVQRIAEYSGVVQLITTKGPRQILARGDLGVDGTARLLRLMGAASVAAGNAS